jgi:hypothetical protein
MGEEERCDCCEEKRKRRVGRGGASEEDTENAPFAFYFSGVASAAS